MLQGGEVSDFCETLALFTSFKKMENFYFTGNNDGYGIEECIKNCKSQWENSWRLWINTYFRNDAKVWWCSLDARKMDAQSDEDF